MKSILNIIKLFLASNTILFTIVILKIYPNLNIEAINNALCSFDCNWYVNISTDGYVFKENIQSNTAFFPLLPLLIKLLSNNLILVSIVNQLIFATSFSFFVKYFNIEKQKQLIYFASGLIIFYLIPYSESLFFLGSCLILYALNSKKILLLVLGIYIACLSRSASLIFSVAFLLLFIEALINRRKEYIYIYFISLLVVILSTYTVFYFQYLYTGELYSYFNAQESWKHSLGIPELPFRSWGWQSMISDVPALVVGVICIGILIKQFYLLMLKETNYNSEYLFSLLYLAGITLSIIIFQGGDLHSINRYVFSSAFFLLLISRESLLKNTKAYILLIIIALSLLIIKRFTYIEQSLIYTLMSYIYLKLILTNTNSYRWNLISVIILMIFQLVLLNDYLSKNWIG